MKILVINAGSSSIKYQLLDMESREPLAVGDVTRIGMSASVVAHKPFDRPQVKISAEILDHIQAIEHVVAMLMSKNHGVIKDRSEIGGVGHRVVHGGEKYTDSILVTPEVMMELRHLVELAPLHNPHNIRGIQACMKILKGIPQVAVFDTAFYHKMPPHAFLYGLPYILYRKYKIRRYGFHGISHHYVSGRAAALLGRSREELKLITAHLGNGASITAIDHGVAVDTSMGFTPLEGLVMGSRSGDMDPAVILHLIAREELSLHEANTLLNKHSGLQGVSGISSDMKDILEERDRGNRQAKLALDLFCYRLRKYIGAYLAVLGGADALVFTAGIGENSPVVRELSCRGLEGLGIAIDPVKNHQAVGVEGEISAKDSRIRIFVVPTNEELVIATDTMEIIEASKRAELSAEAVTRGGQGK
jgi:acetate kinase